MIKNKIKRGSGITATPDKSQACKPSSVFPRPCKQVLEEALIYLAAGSLRRSSDLTRSDTDVFPVGASSPWIGTYLVLLRVEIAPFHPTPLPE